MKKRPSKQLYQVTYRSLSHTVRANSPAHACRLAFRSFRYTPPTTPDGGWDGVEVQPLERSINFSSLETALSNI